MPPVNRNAPKRAKASDSTYSFMEFQREFPNDAACLGYLWREHYSADGEHAECPKCERIRKFHRVKDRPAFDCDSCGFHLHPTAGTIFHKSSTSLVLWFYAIFLMSQTRCGISAKHLEREIGVTYKTAWRMLNRIRNMLMTQEGEPPLSGEVEADETHWGGQPRLGEVERPLGDGERTPDNLSSAGSPWKAAKKSTVFGMVERGGRVRATVAASRGRDSLQGQLVEHVLPKSTVFTDEWPAYNGLDGRYRHRRIRHAEKVYVSGDVHSQTIEGFWGNLKNGVQGTYHAVSRKWLQSYLDEFAFRYNHHDSARPMFRLLLNAVTVARA
jgi:transposase-like protein